MNSVFYFVKKRRLLRLGFTLSEVMIAASVGLIIIALCLGVMLSLTKVYIRTDIKNSVSEDYRDLSRQMMEQGNLSNGFYVYTSFNEADRNKAEKRIPSGGSGDLVVFVFYSVGDISSSPNMQGISRVLGFFREQAGSAVSPIRCFDSAKQSWPGSPTVGKPVLPTAGNKHVLIESLIPPQTFLENCPTLVNHTMGAATDTSGGTLKLFYNSTTNLYGPSLNVTGYILRSRGTSGSSIVGQDSYQSRTAFNFTVAPRIAN